jgi:hypothetical protein
MTGYIGSSDRNTGRGVRSIFQEYGNPNIVTNGLQLYLDVGNPLSYSGSGNIIYDLAPGRPYNMTLFNSPTFSSAYGGVIQLNGTNQYGSTTLNMATEIGTVMCGTRYSGATRGRMVSAEVNNWLLGHHSTSVTEYYSEGWVQDTAVNDTEWRTYAGMFDTGNDFYSFYVNGTSVVSNSTAGSAGPNGLNVGRYGPTATEYSTGEFSFLLAYNRILTAAEVTQNHNFFKNRYGM